jgi:hypothetical protein
LAECYRQDTRPTADQINSRTIGRAPRPLKLFPYPFPCELAGRGITILTKRALRCAEIVVVLSAVSQRFTPGQQDYWVGHFPSSPACLRFGTVHLASGAGHLACKVGQLFLFPGQLRYSMGLLSCVPALTAPNPREFRPAGGRVLNLPSSLNYEASSNKSRAIHSAASDSQFAPPLNPRKRVLKQPLMEP